MNSHTDPYSKAVILLSLLDEPTRDKVMKAMSPEIADRLRERLMANGGAPHALNQSIAVKRRMIRETLISLQQHTALGEREISIRINDGADAGPSPLKQLSQIHPAALTRALQGESADTWAVVLNHIDGPAKVALESYLNAETLEIITQAQERMNELAPALRASAERAIAATVIPNAQEQHSRMVGIAMPPQPPKPVAAGV